MPGIPPNPLYSAFALLSFLLASFPLPWHIQLSNVGSSMFMLWTSLGCLILFVNSIIWDDNVVNSAPVWCDISSRYLVGAGVGIPASSLCIVHRLHHVTTKLRTNFVEKAQRRREIIFDISIGIGLPCVVIALHYVVQPRRFAIFEQVGCYPLTDNTLLAYFLLFAWPLVIGLVSLVYAVLTFRRAFLRREMLRNLPCDSFSISARHYWRLMALCSVEIVFGVPLSVYTVILNAVGGHDSYVSWAQEHSDISQISQYSSVAWQSVPIVVLEIESTRWMYIFCAFVVFAFFGWAREARDVYHQAFWSICRRLRYSKPSARASTTSRERHRFTYGGKPTLPIHDVDQRTRSKHLTVPVQALAKHDYFDILPRFEVLPGPQLPSSSSRLGKAQGSTETLSRHQSVPAHYEHVSWPAALEPTLTRDRRSLAVDQLA